MAYTHGWNSEIYKVKLIERGIELVPIERYVNSTTRIRHHCPNCNGEYIAQPADIIRRKRRFCGFCGKKAAGHVNFSHEDYLHKLNKINPNIEVLEKYVDSRTYIRHRCKIDGHIIIAKPGSYLNQKAYCSVCNRAKALKERANVRLPIYKKFISLNRPTISIVDDSEFINTKQPLKHKCSLDNFIWTVRPVDIKAGSGCPRCTKRGYSKLSLKWLSAIENKLSITIQSAANIGEKKIEGSAYRVDGFYRGIMFEFHGNVYHGNPHVYKPNDKPHPYNNKSAKTLYKETLHREKQLLRKGYCLVSVWESEFKSGKLGTLFIPRLCLKSIRQRAKRIAQKLNLIVVRY